MASHLKAAGKAILNSPKALRRKLAGGGDSDAHAHHDKLDEDWYHSDDPIKAGISFYVKYLGATDVTKTHGPGSTDDAVKTIVHHAKQRGGKLQKVQITVSSKFLKIQDVGNQIKLEEIPLYRVSYCTVDPYYDKVFCYISRNHENKKLECHAFLCSKKSKAEAITLTVAQAFNIAFERWQSQKKKKAARQQQRQEEQRRQEEAKASSAPITNGGSATSSDPANSLGEELKAPVTQPPNPSPLLTSQQSPAHQGKTTPPQGTAAAVSVQPPPPTVIEPVRFSPPPPSTAQTANAMAGLTLTSAAPVKVSPNNPFASRDDTHMNNRSGLLEVKSTMTKAISLDYLHVDDEFDMEFTRLAEARSNPHLLDIGDHMNRSTSRDEVHVLMQGEQTAAANDLSKTKSIDDLLML